MKRIAVLVSNKGTGSNLQAIIDAIDKRVIKNGRIVVVVSNKKDAFGLIRAEKKKIPTEICDLNDYLKKGKTRTDYDQMLALLLKNKYQIDLVVLAGWVLILSDKFINYFPDRIINLHPGLLPNAGELTIKLKDGTIIEAIRGLHTDAAVQYAIKNNFPVTGSTVHFITPKVDDGPVILRSEVKISHDDTVESLYKRMKEQEYQILPKAIALFCQDKLMVKNGLVKIL